MADRRTDSASLLIRASPERIWGAFEDPAALMTWLPPEGMSGRANVYDFRVNGRYLIELELPEGSAAAGKTTERTDVTFGRFVELVRDRRIVQTVGFDSADPSFAGEMMMTWTFEPAPDGTRVTVAAVEVPAGISAADHAVGLRSSLENLARYLAPP